MWGLVPPQQKLQASHPSLFQLFSTDSRSEKGKGSLWQDFLFPLPKLSGARDTKVGKKRKARFLSLFSLSKLQPQSATPKKRHLRSPSLSQHLPCMPSASQRCLMPNMTGYAALAECHIAKSTTCKVFLLDQNVVTSSDITPQNQLLETSHGIAAKGFDPSPVFTSSSSSNFGFSFLLLPPVFPAVSEGAASAAEASPTDGRTEIIRFLLLLRSFSPDLLP